MPAFQFRNPAPQPSPHFLPVLSLPSSISPPPPPDTAKNQGKAVPESQKPYSPVLAARGEQWGRRSPPEGAEGGLFSGGSVVPGASRAGGIRRRLLGTKVRDFSGLPVFMLRP